MLVNMHTCKILTNTVFQQCSCFFIPHVCSILSDNRPVISRTTHHQTMPRHPNHVPMICVEKCQEYRRSDTWNSQDMSSNFDKIHLRTHKSAYITTFLALPMRYLWYRACQFMSQWYVLRNAKNIDGPTLETLRTCRQILTKYTSALFFTLVFHVVWLE